MSGVFISYRRDDSQALAGRLFDRLTRRFGKDRVFRDIDTIDPGAKFAEVIGERIGGCDALIALIGKGWLEAKDAEGRRRLDLPRDFVKAEIAAALAQSKLVIPALVEGTPMPVRESLPEELAPLVDRNALSISDSRFDFDVGLLISAIDKALAPGGSAPASTVTPRHTGLWAWLSKARTQRTLTFGGAGIAAVVGATWMAYMHLSERQKPLRPTVNATQGGIAAGGNVAVTASTGGTAVIATGNVTIGITLEQHEQSLRRREEEIRQEISKSSAEGTQKIALLEKELADAQLRLQNPAPDLENYKAKLAEASETLDKLKHVFAADQLDQARQALAKGDPSAAELLFNKVLTAGKDGAAEAAYQLGVLAESRIRYAEASRYYGQAAKLDPDNAQYLFAAGRIRVELVRDLFQKTGDYTTRQSELRDAEKELDASYRGFTSRGDLASAAESLIILGDSQRMRWQRDPAIESYGRAETLAKQARQPPLQAKALRGLARTEMSGQPMPGQRDSKSAALHLEEAVRLSVAIEDKTYLFDVLCLTAENQTEQGELILALETLKRAFSIATAFKDQKRLFYAYLDRAEVYLKLAQISADQKRVDVSHETLDLAAADYREAIAIAKTFGWEGLAKWTEDFLKEVEMHRTLIDLKADNPDTGM